MTQEQFDAMHERLFKAENIPLPKIARDAVIDARKMYHHCRAMRDKLAHYQQQNALARQHLRAAQDKIEEHKDTIKRLMAREMTNV